jgi:hypothetical protein
MDQNSNMTESKVFLDPFLKDCWKRRDLIIFLFAPKRGFWELFYKALLKML